MYLTKNDTCTKTIGVGLKHQPNANTLVTQYLHYEIFDVNFDFLTWTSFVTQ